MIYIYTGWGESESVLLGYGKLCKDNFTDMHENTTRFCAFLMYILIFFFYVLLLL